jgi:hypothetical protein
VVAFGFGLVSEFCLDFSIADLPRSIKDDSQESQDRGQDAACESADGLWRPTLGSEQCD